MMVRTLCLLMSLSSFTALHAEEAVTVVTIACDALPQKKKQCVDGVTAWEKATGLKGQVIEAPTGSSNRLTWAQQQLASESPEIDIYQIDTVWGGLLQNHLLPIDLTPEERALYHKTLIQNNTVDGKLLALPWYVDLGLFIYRKDLLEKYNQPVPSTWEELERSARLIQEKERASGNDKLWGFVFSGKAFEGLTCNVNEWIQSAGEEIISMDGKVIVNRPRVIQVLTRIADWVGDIVPPGALNYSEEDSRGVFQSGNAVFIRHWPYVIGLAESDESPIKGKIGVAFLPKEGENGKHASTLGGWQLAVSKYSKNKEAAMSLVKFLTSRDELKRRAIEGHYYPPMPSLYDDEGVQKTLAEAVLIKAILDQAVSRPASQTGSKYNQVSSAIWNTAHKILSKKESGEKAIQQLEKNLNRMSKDGTAWTKQ